MMKKNGFTLAEVLITLAIIGVVATMTLPALMTNTQEQQAKTGLKKGINTLTEAAQMNQSIEGWDYASATDSSETGGITSAKLRDIKGKMSFDGLIANRIAIDSTATPKPPSRLGTTTIATKYPNAVYLKDGGAIYYKAADTKATATTALPQADELALGYVVLYDTNGAAGPNIISNCSGAPLGTDSEISTVTSNFTPVSPITATTACSAQGKRVIKDVFPVRLRNGYAQPEGNAAVWAFYGDVKASGS